MMGDPVDKKLLQHTLMKAATIRQADRLIDHVLTLPVEQQASYIETQCKDDPDLQTLVFGLLDKLQVYRNDGDAPAINIDRELINTVSSRYYQNQKLGVYKVTEFAGSGGMGQVFRGHRDDGYFDQQVAIKVLPEFTRSLTSDAASGFLREIRLMGDIHHPHVARILDAGRDDQGVPYFVMEWVEGQAITQHCKQQQLSLRQRVNLFLQVVDAALYAHRRFVIHRDLKPENVFVEADKGVKILDFGIAQSLADPEGEPGISNLYSRWISTAYASPEQLASQPATAASDQYQLGLLFYELLSGDPLRNNPQTPEQVLADSQQQHWVSATAKAAGRGDWKNIRGDLDMICQRMLQVEPDQRYAGLDEVKADLEAWKAGRPISLRSHQRGYVSGRFIRRHWLALSAVTALFAFLGVFALVTEHQRKQILEQRNIAQQESNRSTRMLDFLLQMFNQVDPYATAIEEMTVPALLEHGVEKAKREFAEDDETRTRLVSSLAVSLTHINQPETAIPVLEEALEDYQAMASPPMEQIGLTALYLGRSHFYLDNNALARKYFEQSIEYLTGVETFLGVDSLAMAYNELGRLQLLEESDVSIGLESYHKALALEQQYPGLVGDQKKALTLHNLAVQQADRSKALEMEKEVLALRKNLWGEHNGAVVHTRLMIAALEGMVGNVEDAVQQFEVALPIQKEMIGQDHRDRAIQLAHYARQLTVLGRFDDAVTAAAEAAQINGDHRAENSPYTILINYIWANALHMQGDHQQAWQELQAINQSMLETGGVLMNYCPLTMALTAEILMLRGDLQQAEYHLGLCDLDQVRSVPAAAHYVDRVEDTRARLRLLQGQPEPAAAWMKPRLQAASEQALAGHWEEASLEALYAWSQMLTDGNEQDGRQSMQTAIQKLQQELQADHWLVAYYQDLL